MCLPTQDLWRKSDSSAAVTMSDWNYFVIVPWHVVLGQSTPRRVGEVKVLDPDLCTPAWNAIQVPPRGKRRNSCVSEISSRGGNSRAYCTAERAACPIRCALFRHVTPVVSAQEWLLIFEWENLRGGIRSNRNLSLKKADKTSQNKCLSQEFRVQTMLRILILQITPPPPPH